MPNSNDSLPRSGQALQRAFQRLVHVLKERQIRYAIIGGIATIQHTRVRSTDDIDALLTVPQLALPALFEALESQGFAIALATNIKELREDGLTTIRFENINVDLLRPILPAYDHVLIA